MGFAKEKSGLRFSFFSFLEKMKAANASPPSIIGIGIPRGPELEVVAVLEVGLGTPVFRGMILGEFGERETVSDPNTSVEISGNALSSSTIWSELSLDSDELGP